MAQYKWKWQSIHDIENELRIVPDQTAWLVQRINLGDMSKATIGLADILSAILPALSLDQMLPLPPTQFESHHHHHQHHHHHPAAIGMVDFCFIHHVDNDDHDDGKYDDMAAAIVSGQQMIKCFSDTETDSAPFSTFCEQEGGGERIWWERQPQGWWSLIVIINKWGYSIFSLIDAPSRAFCQISCFLKASEMPCVLMFDATKMILWMKHCSPGQVTSTYCNDKDNTNAA